MLFGSLRLLYRLCVIPVVPIVNQRGKCLNLYFSVFMSLSVLLLLLVSTRPSLNRLEPIFFANFYKCANFDLDHSLIWWLLTEKAVCYFCFFILIKTISLKYVFIKCFVCYIYVHQWTGVFLFCTSALSSIGAGLRRSFFPSPHPSWPVVRPPPPTPPPLHLHMECCSRWELHSLPEPVCLHAVYFQMDLY